MGRTAQPRHYNDLASSSQRTYGYDFHDYEKRVRAANVPLYAPGEAFLESYLEEEARISVGRAASRIRAIGYAFWKQGLADPTLHLPIREQINAIRVKDREQRLDILGIVPPVAKRFASYFIGDRHAASTLRSIGERARAWELWCVRHGVDAAAPSDPEFVTFVRRYEQTSFANVRNLVRHMQIYFTSRKLHDVTTSSEVHELLEKLRRKPTDSVDPLFFGDLKIIVAGFGTDRLDKRDRLSTLFDYFGPILPSMQSCLQCSDLIREPDGLTVLVNGRELFFDAFPEDPEIDVVAAYDEYLASVMWREGAFFRSLGLRGEYLSKMQPGSICAAINKAGQRAGYHRAAVGLVKGFRIEAVHCFGTIVTARRLGYKDPASLAAHSAQARADVEQVRGRGPRWRGSGKRAKRRGKNPRVAGR